MAVSVAEPVILARSLSRRHGGRWAVRSVDLEVQRGELRMVCGENGAGKTTLIRVLATALAPSGGTLQLFGGDPVAARRRVAMLSHADHHYDELSARENLRLAADLCGRPALEVDAVLDTVGLGGRTDDAVRGFSAGMRKRLAFARVLLKDADLVLLDEPFAGLDPSGANFVDELLRSWRARGTTVVVSTHQIERVAAACDTATVLSAGRAAWTGPADQALARFAEARP